MPIGFTWNIFNDEVNLCEVKCIGFFIFFVFARLMPELREFHFYFVIDIMCL